MSSTKAGDGTGTISNVDVYVIDTGVETTHPDLNVVSFVQFTGGPKRDCNGHGTHVAGTIAAKDDTVLPARRRRRCALPLDAFGCESRHVEQALKTATQSPGTSSKDGRRITREYVGGF